MLERSEVAHCHTVLSQLSSPLVVHHWDADGIASAALLQRIYGWGRRLIPRIDEYGYHALENAVLGSEVVVLDYAASDAVALRAREQGTTTIVVVDHHRGRCPGQAVCCNPVAMGAGGEDEYPSTSLLLYTVLGSGLDLALLGWLGDRPFDVKHPKLGLLAARLGLNPETLEAAARSVDSCYVLLDTECIGYAVDLLARKGVEEAVADPRLARALNTVEELVEALTASAEPRRLGSVVVYEVEANALVTSRLGRMLASENPRSIVVLVHRVPALGKTKIYVRSMARRVGEAVEPVKKALEEMGLAVSIGGKDYVFVVHYHGPSADRVADTVITVLRKLYG